MTTSTPRVQEAKHMVVAGSLGFIYICKHLPFLPAFSALISPTISPFSAVNIFQQTQVSEGEGKKKLLFSFLSLLRGLCAVLCLWHLGSYVEKNFL